MAASPMIPPAHAPDFLARNGWGGADIRPLAGDASFRRYFRVHRGEDTAVLMDAPPEHEDVGPFLTVADELIARGLSAPKALAVDRDGGLLLLEDFGDRLLGPLLRADASDEAGIYRTAIAILAKLAEVPAPAHIPDYSERIMLREAGLFTEWYAPALDLSVDEHGFAAAWRETWAPVLGSAKRHRALVLRDYHADNLILLDRAGVSRLGLLDFQDALAGHPAYDLVSLLQDARRDVSPDLEAEMLHEYAAVTKLDDVDAFRAEYEILGAQRNAKILGIFTRLWKRDGKNTYLKFQPRVWGYLERNLAHPALGPVRAWFDANVPADKRAAAWVLTQRT